jgi:hypothetical protein
VLYGRTVGYRRHPQLERFRACGLPRAAIDAYLMAVHAEAVARGYDFDRTKFRKKECRVIPVTKGQLEYEWDWLMGKLRKRSPAVYRLHRAVSAPRPHPLFRVRPGPRAEWEKVTSSVSLPGTARARARRP